MQARWSDNALVVLGRRYLRRAADGRVIETPEELLQRVARSVASVESRWGADPAVPERMERAFLDAMTRLELLPNSPTLMNAGRELGQLSACFVLPVGDSLPEIFDAVKWTALIQQSG